MTEDQKNFDFQPLKGAFRNTFCQRHFKDCIYDTKIFRMADQILVGYSGGSWDYINFKGVPFFRLSGNERVTLRNPHSCEEMIMDYTLAGMIITFYTMNFWNEKNPQDTVIDKIDALKDLIWNYAEEIGEFQLAYSMID